LTGSGGRSRSLDHDETIDDFLTGFPTVRREQVVAFLEEATARMISKA
jgi:uncharacterized protein (DUF433 family)